MFGKLDKLLKGNHLCGASCLLGPFWFHVDLGERRGFALRAWSAEAGFGGYELQNHDLHGPVCIHGNFPNKSRKNPFSFWSMRSA